MIILVTTGATRITTKRFKKSESHIRKTFNRFATKDITHNMESTAV